MEKRYEMIEYVNDPFDIMCGDCTVHKMEVWHDTTEEELREMFEYELIEEKRLTDIEKEAYADMFGWKPAPTDFNEWLKQEIADGHVRIKEED